MAEAITQSLPAEPRAAGVGIETRRFFDVVVASFLALAAAPLAVLVALLIKLNDKGPVLFWQRRVGQFGREFWFPKFRSMRVGADDLHEELLQGEDEATIRLKLRDDPRVTAVGRLLRRLSIDELPQLWCVLRGDMAMVGPRPPLPCEVAQYTAHELRRLHAKPGLTCIWQVSGRSTVSFEKQVEMDLAYIEQRSLGLDVKLLVQTVGAVLSCRGAW